MAMQPYHVGILVRDLDVAIADFADALGLTFAPIQAMESVMSGAMEGTHVIRATYSTEGPMYVELVEGSDAPDAGMFSLKHGEGLHHLGVWSSDYTAYNARPTCLPVVTGVHLAPGADPTMWLNDPAGFHGVRVEFVDEAMRPALQAWVSGGSPTDAI
jgi:catechol 2,3-dioxygenase-like lactoylglutathione lyase family enzyme